MRIAIVSANRGRVGGVEAYLEAVFGGIADAGHLTAFLSEFDTPASGRPIRVPENAPVWCAGTIGGGAAIAAMRAWRPDLIYAHGLGSSALEAEIQRIAPAVHFAHNYYGTCISGAKTTRFPHLRPCQRRFGWRCLLHFYPHRCGGLNPLTMVADFRRQSRRLQLMRNYRLTLTASEHMRAEYLRHGFPEQTIRTIPLPATAPEVSGPMESPRRGSEAPAADGWRLLFVGRMEALKGAGALLEALPAVIERLGVPLSVTLAGDGRERVKLEARAAELQGRVAQLEIGFAGWLEPARLAAAYRDSDLLVIPSLWPEPFGLVGIEAGMHWLPVAAFAAGGIPEWLKDGVNGHLASGAAPTADGLAAAIVACLRDRREYARLCVGALTIARNYTLANHMRELLQVFEMVAKQGANSTLARPETIAVASA